MTPKKEQYKSKGEEVSRLSLRIPTSLEMRIEESARKNGRSVNLEILKTLEERYRGR